MIFLSQLKTFMKSFKQKRQTSRTAIGEFFSKISNKRKISNKQFHHWILSHRVDWDFTFSALYMFNYGNKFIHIVQVGYTNIQSKNKMNGLLI